MSKSNYTDILGTILSETNFFNYQTILLENKPKITQYYRSLIDTSKKMSHNLKIQKGLFNQKQSNKPIIIVEIGGTVFKISIVNLYTQTPITEFVTDISFEDGIFTLERLFAKILRHLKILVQNEEFRKLSGFTSTRVITQIGVILAFPLMYESIDAISFHTRLVSSAKEIDSSDGLNKIIDKEFKRYWKKSIGTSIQVMVLNDSLASVLFLKYFSALNNFEYDANVNLIIGTGFNIGFLVELNDHILLINSESGFLPISELKNLTIFDENLSIKSITVENFVEQMISGKYLPLLVNEIVEWMKLESPKFDNLQDFLNYNAIDPNRIPLKEIFFQIISSLIERGSEIIAGCVISIIKVLEEVSDRSISNIALLLEGTLLNKTQYADLITDKLRDEFQDAELKIFGEGIADQNFPRFGPVGLAYLMSLLAEK